MKKYVKIFSILLALAFILTAPGFCSGASGEMSGKDLKKPPSEAMKIIDKMKFPPLKFQVPKVGREVERVVLPNGMILYLMEDHRLPQVTINGMIRTGQSYESKEKFGVAELTGDVMRTGGTKNMTPEQLNEELEFIAARVVTSIDRDEGTIYMHTISGQLDTAMKLFADILRYPAFDQKELDLAKSQIKEKLRRANDQVEKIGRREYYRLIYGDHPYGLDNDWQVIKNISRQDLIDWHSKYYQPNNMMFAVVGDFNKKDMIDRFNKLFGDWPQNNVDFSSLKEVKPKFNPGIFYVVKDVNQSFIRLGHLGVKRDNPDVFSILMMDYIMGGGGFNSMMTEKIRSDEGLAYMVFSYYNINYPDYGTAGVLCQTKSKSTIRSIELMRQIMKKMQTDKVTPDQLKWAKDSIINGFIFKFDTPDQQVYRLMMLEYNRMPADYYETYIENIRKVTPEQILQASKKYLHPDKLTIVVVGKPSEFDKPLDSLGEKPQEIELGEFVE